MANFPEVLHMFRFIITALFLFVSINAFAGGRSEIDVIWAEVDDVREHLEGYKSRVRRIEQRQDNLCVGPADNREVVCQKDLGPLIERIELLEHVCDVPAGDRRVVCKDELEKVQKKVKRQKERLDDLETIVTSRRWSLGAGFGPQGTFVPGYGGVGSLTTDLSFTYETAYMGFTVQGGGQFAPNLTTVGGGVTAALFWKVNGLESLALGPLLGGEINDYGLDGSYYEHRVYGPVVGGLLRFTPVETNILALDFSLRGGIKSGVHNIAPGIVGGNGSNGLAMTPFIGGQIEVRFFVRD